MKKQFLFLMLAFGIFTIALSSCTKEENVSSPQVLAEEDVIQGRATVPIYTACWDEWGRASKDCDGWGLCNFEDCWGWQDECCDRDSPSPIVESDDLPGTYELLITLSAKDPQENAAILNQSPLTVDEDISDDALHQAWSTITIRAGVYAFDGKIGDNGGYRIPLVTQ